MIWVKNQIVDLFDIKIVGLITKPKVFSGLISSNPK